MKIVGRSQVKWVLYPWISATSHFYCTSGNIAEECWRKLWQRALSFLSLLHLWTGSQIHFPLVLRETNDGRIARGLWYRRDLALRYGKVAEALRPLFPHVLNRKTVLEAGIGVRIKWEHVYKSLGQSLSYKYLMKSSYHRRDSTWKWSRNSDHMSTC